MMIVLYENEIGHLVFDQKRIVIRNLSFKQNY